MLTTTCERSSMYCRENCAVRIETGADVDECYSWLRRRPVCLTCYVEEASACGCYDIISCSFGVRTCRAVACEIELSRLFK